MRRFSSPSETPTDGMNCFGLIKQVLDEEYGRVGDANTDKIINDQIVHLRQEFEDLYRRSPDVDYDDPLTRFAYVYKYTTANAMAVYNVLESYPDIREVLPSEVELAAIGGGPGSDFLGVVKHLQRRDEDVRLTGFLIDRTDRWGHTWSDVFRYLPDSVRVSLSVRPLDACCPDQSWRDETRYLEADLFTMVKFHSEIHSHIREAQPYLNHVFSTMRSGALIIFVDNWNQHSYTWFDEMAETHRLDILSTGEERMTLPRDEQRAALGDYLERFVEDPLCQFRVSFRIAQKQ